MNESKNRPSNLSSRREFIKTTGRVAAVSALAGIVRPLCPCRRQRNAPSGLDRLRRARHRRGRQCHGRQKRPGQTGGHGRRLSATASTELRGLERAVRRQSGRAARSGSSSDSTPTNTRWIASSRAILRFSPRRWPSAGFILPMPSKRASMSSWKSPSPPTAHFPPHAQAGRGGLAKNLKGGVGLMSRHSRAFRNWPSASRTANSATSFCMRGYRMAGPARLAFSEKWPGEIPSELLWQISRFHSFIWASGGLFNDFYIHHIDHLCMMKNAWPVKAQALGGRHYRKTPTASSWWTRISITTPWNTLLTTAPRCTWTDAAKGCNDIYSSYVHGSKGMAIAAASRRLRRALLHSHRPETDARQRRLDFQSHPGRDAILIRTNGTNWSMPSAPTSLTTKCLAAFRPAS